MAEPTTIEISGGSPPDTTVTPSNANANANAGGGTTPASTGTTATVPATSGTTSAPGVATAVGVFEALKHMPPEELSIFAETLEHLGYARTGPADDGDDAEDDSDDGEDVSVEDTSVSAGNVPHDSSNRKIDINDMTPAARKALVTVHNQLMTRSIKEAIDSDQELGYNLKSLTAKGRESFDKLVKREIGGILDRAGEAFDYDWERTAKAAVAQAKDFLAPMLERRPAMLGVPGAPGNVDSRTIEEPKRVSELSRRDERDKYLADRLKYNLERQLREQTVRTE